MRSRWSVQGGEHAVHPALTCGEPPVVDVLAVSTEALGGSTQLLEIDITRHGKVVARLVPARTRMASDAFVDFWRDHAGFDLQAPPDLPPEDVVATAMPERDAPQ